MADKTVLVVEDDLDTRDFIGDLLADAGHDVIPAGTGKQALDYLLATTETPPDVVVLDLMLPLVSGVVVEAQHQTTLTPAPRVAQQGAAQALLQALPEVPDDLAGPPLLPTPL